MKCRIVSFNKSREFQAVTSVVLPAVRGEMQILPGHAESFIELQKGEVLLRNAKKESLSIAGGICYVKNNEILITL